MLEVDGVKHLAGTFAPDPRAAAAVAVAASVCLDSVQEPCQGWRAEIAG